MVNQKNNSTRKIILNCIVAFVALFINGFGVYLTIHANIGASPWDVFNLGIANTFKIEYGNASITVSLIILLIDVYLREPIGLAMFIDAITVGKAVDFFERLNIVPVPNTIIGSILMVFVGLIVIGYTQYAYMYTSLGCGPRDSLLVGLKKRIKKIPIGVVSITLLTIVTVVGFILGGPIGIGTILCAFCQGPIMQFAFESVKFDATKVSHQNLKKSLNVIFR